jgi:hypothetical protein
LISYSA